jgi:hypothetical protein
MGVTNIPAVSEQFSAEFSADAAVAAPKIRAAYNDIIQAACSAFGFDPNVAIGFMIVENTDVNPSAVISAGAIGLMQLEPATAFQTIKNQAVAMPGGFEVIVSNKLPGFIKPLQLVGFLVNWESQIAAALTDPEFNIWCGCCQLAQLANKSIKLDGEMRIDHMVVMYNAGVGNYYKYVVDTGLAGVDPEALLAQLGIPETTAYIEKLLGPEGAILAALRTQ